MVDGTRLVSTLCNRRITPESHLVFAYPGEFPLPTEKISADMYRMAVKTLTEDFGYEHYEVSNYAQPGKRSRHNQMYWRSEPFWGFGMGAASYVSLIAFAMFSFYLIFIQLNGQRFTRPSTHSEYVQWVEAIQSRKEGMLSPSESEEKTNTEEDRVLETVMLSLRTADGLDLTALPAKYRQKTVEALIPYFLEWEMEEKKGRQDEEKEKLELVQFLDNRGMALLPDSGKDWKEIISENANRVRLTDPDGFLLSNDIISSIFASISTE